MQATTSSRPRLPAVSGLPGDAAKFLVRLEADHKAYDLRAMKGNGREKITCCSSVVGELGEKNIRRNRYLYNDLFDSLNSSYL